MVQGLVLDGQEIPPLWQLGDFEFEIAELTEGRLDKAAGVLRGVAGKAWLRLPCARPPIHTVGGHARPDVSHLTQAVEVVAEVLNPQTEISLAEAQQLRPEVALGDTISLELAVDRADLQAIVELRRGVHDWLELRPTRRPFPRRVQRSDGQSRGGQTGPGPSHRRVCHLSRRRPVSQPDRDRHRRLRARHLVPRAVAPPVDSGCRGAPARRDHRRRLLSAGHDRSRADHHVACVRILRRRAEPGLRALAPRRHGYGHRRQGLRAGPQHDSQPRTLAARLARSRRSVPARRRARSTYRTRAIPATCAATTPTATPS